MYIKTKQNKSTQNTLQIYKYSAHHTAALHCVDFQSQIQRNNYIEINIDINICVKNM